MENAPVSIVLIHWKIKREFVPDFEKEWKTVFTIPNRDGLIVEFLSKVESKGTKYPYITWPITCDDPVNEKNCAHYINVALWNSHDRFFKEIGRNMNDDNPMKDFEIERRRRVAVTAAEWRVGDGELPTSDSSG